MVKTYVKNLKYRELVNDCKIYFSEVISVIIDLDIFSLNWFLRSISRDRNLLLNSGKLREKYWEFRKGFEKVGKALCPSGRCVVVSFGRWLLFKYFLLCFWHGGGGEMLPAPGVVLSPSATRLSKIWLKLMSSITHPVCTQDSLV